MPTPTREKFADYATSRAEEIQKLVHAAQTTVKKKANPTTNRYQRDNMGKNSLNRFTKSSCAVIS